MPACSHAWLFATLWTVAQQSPLSMAFSRQYWNELPCPPPGDLPILGTESASFTSPALAVEFFITIALGKLPKIYVKPRKTPNCQSSLENKE